MGRRGQEGRAIRKKNKQWNNIDNNDTTNSVSRGRYEFQEAYK